MINVSRAINSRTAVPVKVYVKAEGTYDEDNFWVEGRFNNPVTLLATPVPVGDRDDGLFGEQLKPLKSGERTPELMKFTMKFAIEINDYIVHQNKQFKVTRIQNLDSGGFRVAIAAKENERVDLG